MEASLEQHGPATNGAAIDWYRAILSNGKITEDKIKTEAGIFFNLSVEEKAKDKKQFKIHLEGLLKKQKNLETNLVREILKARDGQGKHCENPPGDFLGDVNCDKTRRLEFLKSARDEMKSGLKFLDWRSKEFSLFDSLTETLENKLEKEKATVSHLMMEKGGIQLVRSTCDNVFEAKRQVFSKNSDGTIKKSVIKETYARVTVRQKRKSVDEVSGSAQIKRAKKISDILDHTTEKDKDAKASLMAKIIDQEGAEFGANIEKIPTKLKLNPVQTSNLMTGTRTPEYVLRQARTAFNKTLGFSPISSQERYIW